MSADSAWDLFGDPNPSSDCIVEGEEEDLSASLIGRYAEFVVCAHITKAGYYVTHVDGVGFDLVMKTDDGSYTIQVKSTRYIKDGWCRWRTCIHEEAGRGGRNTRRPQRPISPHDADMLALYHHVYDTALVIPVTHTLSSCQSFKVHQIRQASIEASLVSVLAYFKGAG